MGLGLGIDGNYRWTKDHCEGQRWYTCGNTYTLSTNDTVTMDGVEKTYPGSTVDDAYAICPPGAPAGPHGEGCLARCEGCKLFQKATGVRQLVCQDQWCMGCEATGHCAVHCAVKTHDFYCCLMAPLAGVRWKVFATYV